MSRILKIMIVLILLNCLGAGFLWYGYTTIQAKKAEEAGLQTQIAEASQESLKLKTLSNTLAAAERERAALEKYLLDSSEESQIALISQMENMGSSTTGALVTITSLNLSAGPPKNLHGEFAITGTWSQVYHFLRLVEAFPTKVRINRFSVSGSPSTGANAGGGIERWVGSIAIDFVSLK